MIYEDRQDALTGCMSSAEQAHSCSKAVRDLIIKGKTRNVRLIAEAAKEAAGCAKAAADELAELAGGELTDEEKAAIERVIAAEEEARQAAAAASEY